MRSILPGRPQSSRQALCTVNWDGLRLVAYISGNSLVIFNGRREILQSISIDDAEPLRCLITHEETGHIAVSDSNTVYLYQPFGREYGDLRWTRTSILPHETEDSIQCLSWGAEEELLVAGDRLTLWNLSDEERPSVIWASNVSSPVSVACFSPDAGLIASVSQHDRMVKIWRRLSYEQDSTRFDVSYLPHPSAVTNLSWRSFWHQDQSLDNLLYTFCADNQVRVWAHSEQHSDNIMQHAVTIDTSVSIQPRRLSVGSVSKNRFTFMLESKDIARAAERSLQTYRNGTDHALENFIQIANRSPEVCVILDGLGHMSAWGIENAALRNKHDADKFNVALVDGVDISLPPGRGIDDRVQIHAFANNDASASLCILVHTYSGQIDWYQGSFVEFFDTAARTQRTRLLSCWSGHDSPIEKLTTSENSQGFISIDEQDNGISWSKTAEGALVRRSRLQFDMPTIDSLLMDDSSLIVSLHNDSLSLWDARGGVARKLGMCTVGQREPLSMTKLQQTTQDTYKFEIAVLFDDHRVEVYGVAANLLQDPETNGLHEPAKRLYTTSALNIGNDDAVVFGTSAASAEHDSTLSSLSDEGQLKVFSARDFNSARKPDHCSSLATSIRSSNIIVSTNANTHAFAHTDYRTVSVWNLAQGVCEFVESFDDMDAIQDLHWHSSPSGQLVLAIQFPHNVVILGQQRYSSTIPHSSWKLLQTIRTRKHTTIPIDSLCWLQPCMVIVGAGSQILVFDVLLTDTHGSQSMNGTQTRNTSLNASVHLRLTNSSLPIFSADVLSHMLESGHFSTISTTFHALYEELRYLVQGERIDTNLDETLIKSVLAEAHRSSSNGTLNPTTPNDSVNESDFRGIQKQLQEGISKMSQQQIPLEMQRHLQSLTQTYLQLIENRNSLDPHALTYLYHFLSITSTLAPDDAELPPLPLPAIVHAFLSQTQEALTFFILQHLEHHNIKFTWRNARSLGIFLFTSDIEALKVHLESVAKAEYNRNSEDRNPVNCSLYYLALDKKAVLQALWRRTIGVREKENTLKLLARDFKEPKARATALKNAYALLSKRRFEYAAAFFLLGGSLSDAVNVCINQLHDIQLAVAITRAWSGDPSDRERVMNNLVEKDVLNAALDSHEARWWGVWGSIQRDNLPQAIQYLTQPIDRLFEAQVLKRRQTETEDEKKKNMPLGCYSYLANNPSLLITMYTQLRDKLVKQNRWTLDVLSPRDEWKFVMRCANWYTRAGMDVLGLMLVSTWQFVPWQDAVKKETSKQRQDVVEDAAMDQKSALDEWLMPEDTSKTSSGDKKETKKSSIDAEEKPKPKPPPTQFYEPSADSLLDSFGF